MNFLKSMNREEISKILGADIDDKKIIFRLGTICSPQRNKLVH